MINKNQMRTTNINYAYMALLLGLNAILALSYSSNDIQAGTFDLAQTSTYYHNSSYTANTTYFANFTFLAAKSNTNYIWMIGFQKFYIDLISPNFYSFRNSPSIRSQDRMQLKIQINPAGNFRSWKIRYLIIDSSIPHFHQFSPGVSYGALPGTLSSTTHVTLSTPINITGGYTIFSVLYAFMSNLTANQLGFSTVVTLVNSTRARIVFTNKASIQIFWVGCAFNFIIFNDGQVRQGGIVTVFYGSLTRGNSFSNSNISKGKTFYAIQQLKVSNQSFIDINLDVTGNTISVNSANSQMPSLIVDYIVFHLINVCGNGQLNTTEGCDDGNLRNGDGCSSNCTIQTGFYCTNVSNISVCCLNQCLGCINATICTSCYPGSYLFLPDYACLFSCPRQYYQNQQYNFCAKCPQNCLTCNQTHCLKCLIGDPAVGSCTNISGCMSINSSLMAANNCLTCQDQYSQTGGICTCLPDYWIVTGYCTNVIGCIAARTINYSSWCIGCNMIAHFVLVNYTCQCIRGFSLNLSLKKCYQLCGDGIIIFDQCDDGNLLDGDGCSSKCKTQKLFRCYNGSGNHQSDCVYIGKDLRMSHLWSNKTDNVDEGLFQFSLLPSNRLTSQSGFIQSVRLVCQPKILNMAWTYSQGKLLISADYQQDLEGRQATIIVYLNANVTQYSQINVTFSMVSRGAKLIISQNYAQIMNIQLFIEIVSFVILAIFFASNFTHKMIGVQTIHSFQIIYFICIISNNQTQPYIIFRFLTYVNLNFLFYSNYSNNYFSKLSPIEYQSENQVLAKVIILALIGLPILLNIIKKYGMQDRIINAMPIINKICQKSYKIIVFPVIIGFLFEIFSFKTSQIYFESYLNLLLDFSLRIILAMVFFLEWICLLRKAVNLRFVGLKRCSARYIPCYLSYSFLLMVVLIAANLQFIDYYLELSSAIVLTFFIMFIKTLPYRDNIHNAGQIINLLMVCVFLLWSVIRKYDSDASKEENQILVISVICLLMMVSVILAIARCIFEAKISCKQRTKIEDKNDIRQQGKNDLREKQKAVMIDTLNKFNRYFVDVQNFKGQMLEWNELNAQRQDIIPNVSLFSQEDIRCQVSKLHPIYVQNQENRMKNNKKKQRKPLFNHQSKKILNV